MQRQISPQWTFSCSAPSLAPNLAALSLSCNLSARGSLNAVLEFPGTSGKWVQADRGARSNQTPFLAGEQNAAYLAAVYPANGRTLTDDVVGFLFPSPHKWKGD